MCFYIILIMVMMTMMMTVMMMMRISVCGVRVSDTVEFKRSVIRYRA